jgi:hypothetical protein
VLVFKEEMDMSNGCETKSDDSEVISTYSRRQALEDRELVDVTEAAREVGFGHSTAVTRAVWERYIKVPDAVSGQDERGRLHDVVWMARCGIPMGCPEPEVPFVLVVDNDGKGARDVMLKAVAGRGDQGERVITIMLPEED